MATIDPSKQTDHIPLPTVDKIATADEIATALQSLPDVFFHQIASRVLEIGIDGHQLMALVYSVQPAERSTRLNNSKTTSDEEVKASSSSKREIEQNLDEGQERSRMVANPSKKQKFRTSNDVSIPSATQDSSNLPTPEEIAAVLQLGSSKYFQKLSLHVLEMGIDGKQLKEFIFSFLPPIPMNVIRGHILPLLDRVSWNRYCSTTKEIYDTSRNVTPPWPYKSLEIGSRLWSLAFSPDSGSLACACTDGAIHI
jgi:hypothetical protein